MARHHFVPQFYLRNFESRDDEGRLVVKSFLAPRFPPSAETGKTLRLLHDVVLPARACGAGIGGHSPQVNPRFYKIDGQHPRRYAAVPGRSPDWLISQ